MYTDSELLNAAFFPQNYVHLLRGNSFESIFLDNEQYFPN